jgi:ABC-type xylose transport system permease subunit
MISLLRQIGWPVLAGAGVYFGVSALLLYTPIHLGANAADLAQSTVYNHLAPWLPMVQLLVPGIVCGALAKTRPLAVGASAGFIGGVAVSLVFETVWEPPFHPYSLWLILQSGLVAAVWLLAGAATGFQLRRMGSNNALKPTAGDAARLGDRRGPASA